MQIHVLTSEEDHVLAAWMLASWIHFTGRNWDIVLHEDGSLLPESGEALRSLFPGLKIVDRAEANQAMEKFLKSHPHCKAYREKHPLGLKIFDMASLNEGERLIILDSDVLFFKEPKAMLEWNDRSTKECYFNEDVAEAAVISELECMDRLKIKLWPKVNSGICLIYREAIDLDFCERCLSETSVGRGKLWRIEQTLFALCASRAGNGGLLPPEYKVSLAPIADPGIVARHYVGAVRHLFYGEGMARLKSVLLPT